MSARKKIGVSILVISAGIIIALILAPAGNERVTDPAEFQISNLSINPQEVSPGEIVTISVDVKNIGGETGTKALKFKINGDTETKNVTVNSGETVTVSVSVTKQDVGVYNVTIFGISDSFEVVKSGVEKSYYDLHFEWDFEGEWTWDIKIPEDEYKNFSEKERVMDYSKYVTNPEDDEWIKSLAEKLEEAAREEGWDDFRTVSYVLAFIQSMEYTEDKVTTGYDEYPRYPIETLVDKGGDCEDTSILFTSVVREMGYGVALLELEDDQHMAAGVSVSQNLVSKWNQPYPLTYYQKGDSIYAYCETTGDGWKLGQMPADFESETAKIIEVY